MRGYGLEVVMATDGGEVGRGRGGRL